MRWKILKQKLLLLTGGTPCELQNGVFSHAMGFTGTILVNVHYSDVIVGAMTSQITASRLFTQPFIQAQIKENIKAPRRWPLCREFTAQMASNAENVSIWWRHHATLGIILMLQQYKLLLETHSFTTTVAAADFPLAPVKYAYSQSWKVAP